MLTNATYLIYVYLYKEDLTLNNLRWLIYHKTYQNQNMSIQYICIKSIW